MFLSSPTSDDVTLPMSITQDARLSAQTFAQQQPSQAKAEQVYHNTLAVWVVNSYLRMLGIVTDLAASDSWNPVLRLANDVADLVLAQGRLECRFVKTSDTTCYVPLEVQCDRIAYVIVRLDTDQDATLLGFVDQVSSDYLPLEDLRPISELPLYLADLEPVVDLRQWLEGLYQLDWQSPEKLLRPKQLVLSHQQARVQRAKLIKLNLHAEHSDAVLLLSLTPQDDVLSVRIQLHPAIVAEGHPAGTRLVHSPLDCLMPNIRLSLQTQEGILAKEVIARTYPRDNCIQIPAFQGHPGERFTIQIAMDGYQVDEHFQL